MGSESLDCAKNARGSIYGWFQQAFDGIIEIVVERRGGVDDMFEWWVGLDSLKNGT